MSDLSFNVQDVYVAGLVVERGPMKPISDRVLHAQIGFDVEAAQFSPGESRLKITTRFRISLFQDERPDHAQWSDDAPNLVGKVETRFTANIDASRPIEEADVAESALEPALELALPAVHPYHRALVESHTSMLGVSPLRLPVQWSEVAANIADDE